MDSLDYSLTKAKCQTLQLWNFSVVKGEGTFSLYHGSSIKSSAIITGSIKGPTASMWKKILLKIHLLNLDYNFIMGVRCALPGNSFKPGYVSNNDIFPSLSKLSTKGKDHYDPI